MAEAAGHRGAVECELLLSLRWWREDPDHVLAVIKERYSTAW